MYKGQYLLRGISENNDYRVRETTILEGKAEPSRAELNRAEPSRAKLGRARLGRAWLGRVCMVHSLLRRLATNPFDKGPETKGQHSFLNIYMGDPCTPVGGFPGLSPQTYIPRILTSDLYIILIHSTYI